MFSPNAPSRPALALRLAAAAILSTVTVACGAQSKSTKVEYSVSAKQNYEKGQEKLEDENWIAAAKYFSFIKARFPYSKYATLAELRLADAEFGAGQHLAAIDSYKLFVKFHPTHDSVVNGYASFRVGESYFKMLPSDFWLLPPSYEKDQASTMDAYRELTKFVEKYPKSPYVKRAGKMILECGKRLAAHEWYVAEFYYKNDKPMGTVLRLRELLDSYPNSGYGPRALLLLGRAYVDVKMPAKAKDAWQKLVEKHPKTQQAKQARSALAKLSG